MEPGSSHAVHEMRKRSQEDNPNLAKHFLVELLGISRGLPTKIGQMMSKDPGD